MTSQKSLLSPQQQRMESEQSVEKNITSPQTIEENLIAVLPSRKARKTSSDTREIDHLKRVS